MPDVTLPVGGGVLKDDPNYPANTGTTAGRPTSGRYVGMHFWDTTLNKPIWFNGTNWVDATGATV